MRQEAKRGQQEDRMINLFRRRNKTFPMQFGEETPDAQETLAFLRAINNKEVSEAWREDDSIREVLPETLRDSKDGDADGVHSRKRNLMMSSGARPPGRRAELTASTHSNQKVPAHQEGCLPVSEATCGMESDRQLGI